MPQDAIASILLHKKYARKIADESATYGFYDFYLKVTDMWGRDQRIL
jgi:hypothetical protein